jgi:hypothetical protein
MKLKLVDRLKNLEPTRFRKLIVGSTGLAVTLLLAFHFTMTFLHLEPDNPFRDQLYTFVSGYMSPYFTQNWRLFAPSPDEPSKHIVVSCRFGASGMEDSPHFDVTAPHYEALHKYRLSASQRMIRAQVYPLTIVHPPKDMTIAAMEKMAQSNKETERLVAQALEDGAEVSRKRGLRMMSRLASAECERRYPDTQIAEVQLLYFQEKAPKFSQRNDPDAPVEVTSLDYGWFPYENVATYQ